MGAIAGKSGSFKVSTNVVADLNNFKLDVESDLKTTTNYGSNGWEENLPTIKKWSGSVDGNWNMADTNGQKALQDAILGGTAIAAVFNINGTNNYAGNAYIKKISVQEPVDDIAKFTAEIVGTGALSYT